MMFFKKSAPAVPVYSKTTKVPYAGVPPHDKYRDYADGYRSDAYSSWNGPSYKAKIVATVDRRATTPVPPRPRRDSVSSMMSHSSRTKSPASGTSKSPPKSILKPWKKAEKVEPESPPQCKGLAGYEIAQPKSKPIDHGPTRQSSYKAFQHSTPSPPAYPLHKSSSLSKPTSYGPPPSTKVQPVWTQKVPLKAEQISLNWPLLSTTNSKKGRQSRAVVRFDVGMRPPMGIRIYARDSTGSLMRDHLGHRVRCQYDVSAIPASTHCDLTEMVIFTDDIPGWSVRVRNKEGVNCFDVFLAIYESLQTPMDEPEIRYINEQLGSAVRHKFWSAFAQRCADSGISQYTGARKVDILTGTRFFDGLVQEGSRWRLSLSV